MTSRSEHRRGVLLMASAALCWSLAGIILRNTEVANAWNVVFWRSLASLALMLALYVYWHRREAARRILATGWAGYVSGAMLAIMIVFFLFAIQATTVANTQVIMSLAPFTAALTCWVALRERVPARTLVAMLGALAGIVLMFADSLGTGRMAGNLLAMVVPIAYGVSVMILRKAGKHVDMMPMVLLGSLFSLLAALPLAQPLEVSLHDIALLAFMGFVQLALGCILFVKAARVLSAAEIGLIGLLEALLAPLWVWIGVGERPSNVALAGGGIVLASLAANELLSLWRSRESASEQAEAVRL